MSESPAIIKRAQKRMSHRTQSGEIVSFTTVHHAPAGFPNRPRTIGLIKLEDKTQVLGELLVSSPHALAIGQSVTPRMSLSRVREDGLRVYDIAYEVSADVPAPKEQFNGYILALTGPSGVGKSTVRGLLSTTIGSYATPVPIITTRMQKEGDEQEYTYVSQEEFMQLKAEGAIVAATNIPSSTETRWYGYRSSDIEAIWNDGKMPIVITEKDLLLGLSTHFGRRSILSFGLLPPGKSKRMMLSHLLHRLRSRGRDSEQSIRDRMKNAEEDLQFFKEQRDLFDDLLVNEDLDTVITALKGHVLEVARS